MAVVATAVVTTAVVITAAVITAAVITEAVMAAHISVVAAIVGGISAGAAPFTTWDPALCATR
jgi:hypothetical protein